MKLSRLKYYAFTYKGYEKLLKKELKPLVKNPYVSNIYGKKGIEFRASFCEVLDVLKKSKLINSLKVQIGKPFKADNISLLDRNIRKLDYSFLIDKNLNNIENINIKCFSKNSMLYHTKMIEENFYLVLKEYLDKEEIKTHLSESEIKLLKDMQYKEDLENLKKNEINPNFEHHMDFKDKINFKENLDNDINFDYKQKLQEKEKINKLTKNIDVKFLDTDNKKINNEKQNIFLKKKKNIKNDLVNNIFVYGFNDYFNVSLEIFNTNEVKTGYKKHIGWGSVKENIINGFLQKSGLLEKFKKEKKIQIFDPFCGSGTIFLESIIASLNLNNNNIDFKNLNILNYPIVNKNSENFEELKKYNKNIEENIEEDIRVSLIGTDISKKQLDNSINNFKDLDKNDILKKLKPLDTKVILELKQNLKNNKIAFKNFYNKILFVNSSYEEILKNSSFLNNYTLITNIPYGIQNHKNSINNLYKEFDEFLKNNNNKFEEIYVLYILSDKIKNNFVQSSDFNWKPVVTFFNDGKMMAFFKFENKKNSFKDENIVKFKKVIKRRNRKQKIITDTYDLNKIHLIKQNSKKNKDKQKMLLNIKRNKYLEKKSEIQKNKIEKFKKNMKKLDQKEALKMLSNANTILDKDQFEKFKKQLDSKMKSIEDKKN